MEITCPQRKLVHAIAIAERVVGKKESLPALSCLLFSVDKKGLTIRATNLETGVEVFVPGEVKGGGTCAAPVSVVSSTTKMTRGESITLSLDNENLTVSSKGSNATIKTIPADEFPTLPRDSKGSSHRIPKHLLVDGIQAVSFAASQSMIRPELASVYVTTLDGHMIFVATDSFRLSEKKVATSIEDIPDLLIPVKNALELVHVLEQEEDESEAVVLFDEAQMSVEIGSVYFTSRVINGTFPDYQRIMPQSFTSEAVLLKEDFANVLKKARVFSSTSQQIGFHVYPKKKVFSTTASNADVGEMSDTLEAAVSGDDIDINFNLHYLSDVLQAVHADSVSLGFAGPAKPLVIKPVGDGSFTYLVMPLNK